MGNRAEDPHHATVTIKVDVRKINPDGTLDHDVMGNKSLAKYSMATKAQWCISGPSEAACIKKVKERLEKLNG